MLFSAGCLHGDPPRAVLIPALAGVVGPASPRNSSPGWGLPLSGLGVLRRAGEQCWSQLAGARTKQELECSCKHFTVCRSVLYPWSSPWSRFPGWALENLHMGLLPISCPRPPYFPPIIPRGLGSGGDRCLFPHLPWWPRKQESARESSCHLLGSHGPGAVRGTSPESHVIIQALSPADFSASLCVFLLPARRQPWPSSSEVPDTVPCLSRALSQVLGSFQGPASGHSSLACSAGRSLAAASLCTSVSPTLVGGN